jgi:transcriptional regulator with XRE-family HTH domain
MLLSKDELLNLKQQNKSDREIGGIFGISEAFVTYLLKKYGINTSQIQQPVQHQLQQVDINKVDIEKASIPPPIKESAPPTTAPAVVKEIVKIPSANKIASQVAVEPPLYPLSYSTTDSFGKKVRLQLTRDQLIRLQNELRTDKKIAEKLKISSVTVMQLRKKYGIESKRAENRNKTSISRETLIELQKQYCTDRKIAESLGISQLYVFHLRKKYDIKSIRKSIEPEISKERFLELQKELGSDSEIAKNLNIPTIRVSAIRRKYDIASIKNSKSDEVKYIIGKEELLQMQKELKSDRKIAESIGKSLSYVFHMRKHYDVPIYHKNDNEKIVELDKDKKINFLFNKLTEIRHNKNLKQYEFAQKIGISDAHLRKFEHGMKYPRIYILLKMMNEFNINPNYLFVDNEMQKYLEGEQTPNTSFDQQNQLTEAIPRYQKEN